MSILASVVLSSTPLVVERGFLQLGRFQRPGRTLDVNNCCLELDGKPWVPVMGEFHYSRYPRGEWETELRRLRAGGVDIVASYVMWNHHEAEQGDFDWSGQRDLCHFVSLAQKVGLHFYLRPGPWVHAQQSGDDALLVVDGRRAAEHHAGPRDGEGRPGPRCQAHQGRMNGIA